MTLPTPRAHPPTRTRRTRRTPSAAAAAGLLAASLGAVAMAPATAVPLSLDAIRSVTTTTGLGAYHPITPTRLLDTRNGLGAAMARLGAGASLTLQVAGRGGVPQTGVSAVVLNLTGVSPTAGTYVTAYPADSPRPGVSSLNLDAGTIRANLVTVPLHADGRIDLVNAAGSIDLVADVVGVYAGSSTVATQLGASGGFLPVTPKRLFDSRADGVGAFVNGDTARIPVSFSDTADSRIRALVVTVTVTGATSPGYVRLWSASVAEPGTSSLNFVPGVDVANTAVVEVGACGASCASATYAALPAILARAVLASNAGQAHVVVDLVGVTTTGVAGLDSTAFAPLGTPTRIVDSRRALGASRLGTGTIATVATPAAVMTTGAAALAANVTLVTPSQPSYLTAWSAGEPWPATSIANTAAGHIVASGTTIGLDGQGRFALRNAQGSADVVVDVAGTFAAAPGTSVTPLVTRSVGQHAIRVGPRPTPPPVTVAPDPVTVAEVAINTDINAYRTSHGRAALVRDSRIDALARGWSQHMAATAALEHNPNVSAGLPPGWTSWGENIVMSGLPSTSTPEEVAQVMVSAWIQSPGHLANLSNAAYTSTGIGVARSADGTWWATQDFAQYR